MVWVRGQEGLGWICTVRTCTGFMGNKVHDCKGSQLRRQQQIPFHCRVTAHTLLLARAVTAPPVPSAGSCPRS